MRKSKLLLALFFLSTIYCKAQIYFEPIIGYQLDLNNHPRLNQMNTSLQFAFKCKKSELLLTVEKSWGINRFVSDSAFTPNPALPLYSAAAKKASANTFSFLVSRRRTIFGNKTGQHVNFLASVGVSHQQIGIDYTYDKYNYTILNPDKTISATGLALEVGLEYMLPVKNGRFFAQAKVGGMAISKKSVYPNSIFYTSPFSINVDYSIQIKKRHEKK